MNRKNRRPEWWESRHLPIAQILRIRQPLCKIFCLHRDAVEARSGEAEAWLGYDRLTVRAKRCLHSNSIQTVNDLIEKTPRELMGPSGNGAITVDEIIRVVAGWAAECRFRREPE